MGKLWTETDWFPLVVVAGGGIALILALVWLGSFGVAVVNRSFAADAYGKCAVACGANGVRLVNPDYKCECNTGQPGMNVDLRGRTP